MVIFSSELDCDRVQEKLNALQPALFSSREGENTLDFLDALGEKEGTGPLTSIFRKQRLPGNTPALVHRPLGPVSTWVDITFSFGIKLHFFFYETGGCTLGKYKKFLKQKQDELQMLT